jgi:hypothetical protein
LFYFICRDLKSLNTQHLKDSIDHINKQLPKFATTESVKKLETETRILSTRVDKHTGELKTLQDLVRDLKMMPRPSSNTTKITQIHAPVVDLNPIYSRVSYLLVS